MTTDVCEKCLPLSLRETSPPIVKSWVFLFILCVSKASAIFILELPFLKSQYTSLFRPPPNFDKN